MKKRTRKMRAWALLITLSLLLSMIPASAYASDVPIVLRLPATEIDVIVSERILLEGQDGTAELKVSPLTVTNNGSLGSIVVSEITAVTENGWTLVAENAGFETMAANAKRLYMGYKSHDFAEGSFTGTIAEAAPGESDTIQILAKTGAQTEDISNVAVAQIILTINLKENTIRWGYVYSPQILNESAPAFIFYEDGSMDFGSMQRNVISSLPAGSLTYTENIDGTVTAVSNTAEGTNTFLFSSDLTSVTVESSYLDSGSNVHAVNDLTYKCDDVNIHFGEEYYGFFFMGQNDDASIIEQYCAVKFEPDGSSPQISVSTEGLGPFSYFYYNNGSYAEAINIDTTWAFDENAETAINTSWVGEYTFSLSPSAEVQNAVAWEKKYTGEVLDGSLSFEFYLNGDDVTAKLYSNDEYVTTFENILFLRQGTTYGMIEQDSGNIIMFSADASECLMYVAEDGSELTLTLEE